MLFGVDVMRAIALVLCLVLVGCGESEADKQRRLNSQMQHLGESYVKGKLKDAGSAEFRHQFISLKGAPCGEVNARNSFGGYTGFIRYIAASKDLTIVDGVNIESAEFEKVWREFCQR